MKNIGFSHNMLPPQYCVTGPRWVKNRGGERRWPQNKTGVVHRYQATVNTTVQNTDLRLKLYGEFYGHVPISVAQDRGQRLCRSSDDLIAVCRISPVRVP